MLVVAFVPPLPQLWSIPVVSRQGLTQQNCWLNMIPSFLPKGHLPKGIHHDTWEEFFARFGHTKHRKQLLEGMKLLLSHLKSVGCRSLYVDGSFVTAKETPND